MDEKDRKRYIQEIFKYCKTDSILIISAEGHLERLWRPFRVLVIVDVPPLRKGQEKLVIAVKVAEDPASIEEEVMG